MKDEEKILATLNQYPLSIKFIQDWVKTNMSESLKLLESDDNFNNEIKKIFIEENATVDRIVDSIHEHPRSLFDLFDENDIIIGMSQADSEGFQCVINKTFIVPGGIHAARKDAERIAVDCALSMLESQLSLKNIESNTENENDNDSGTI